MKVFLSYRRADSQPTAGRMAQFLDGIPAVDEVFLDVDAIAVGENFEHKIQETLAKSTHMFVLIGSEWAGSEGRRILDPDDMVRLETRMALASEVKLIPILLDNANMPRQSELPDDLKALAKINAFALRASHFDEDMDALLDVVLGDKKGRGSRWREAPLTPFGIAARAAAGLVVCGFMLILLGIAQKFADKDCPDLVCLVKTVFDIDQVTDAQGLLAVMVIIALCLSAVAPFVPRLIRRRR